MARRHRTSTKRGRQTLPSQSDPACWTAGARPGRPISGIEVRPVPVRCSSTKFVRGRSVAEVAASVEVPQSMVCCCVRWDRNDSELADESTALDLEHSASAATGPKPSRPGYKHLRHHALVGLQVVRRAATLVRDKGAQSAKRDASGDELHDVSDRSTDRVVDHHEFNRWLPVNHRRQ